MIKEDPHMSHINEAFKNGKALIAFLTTGTPSIEDTVRYVLDMEKAGATLIELGVPFSDPIADGPVIMEADVKALKNGIHLPQVMETVKEIRKHTAIPIVLLTYYNPVFRYPADRFFQEAKEIGIDGVIIPDLPGEEQQEIRPLADENGVDIIGKKMTLLGAGGAATAILVQAALDGVAEINVFNVRDNFFGRAEEIVAKLNERTSCKVTLHDFSDPEVLRASIADSAILVNGTSVGMAPKTENTIITDTTMS